MIVDDSPNDIHMLLEALQGTYQMSAATSGEDALEALEEDEKPEIILLDVNMPGMNGYETCEKIKNNIDTQNIEIIFLSAKDTTDEILRGLESGAIDYIVKPYDLEVLNRKIQKALDNIESQKAMNEQVAYATKIATTAMSDSGDQGIILNFMRANYQIDNGQARNTQMANIIKKAQDSLSHIKDMHVAHKNDSVKIVDEMQAKVEEAFLTMGLTETQEEQLFYIVSVASHKMLDNFDKGDVIDDKFMEIIHMLSEAAKNM